MTMVLSYLERWGQACEEKGQVVFLRKRRCLPSWGSLGQPRIWGIGSPDFKGAPGC